MRPQTYAMKMKALGRWLPSEKIQSGRCRIPAMMNGIVLCDHFLIPFNIATDANGINQTALQAPSRGQTQLPAAISIAQSDRVLTSEDMIPDKQPSQPESGHDVDDGKLRGDEKQTHERGEQCGTGHA